MTAHPRHLLKTESAVVGYAPEVAIGIQRELLLMKMDIGSKLPDGVIGPKSRAALDSLSPTDRAQIEHMGRQYAITHDHMTKMLDDKVYVEALQRQMKEAGVYKGRIDGVYGKQMVAAERQFNAYALTDIHGNAVRASAEARYGADMPHDPVVQPDHQPEPLPQAEPPKAKPDKKRGNKNSLKAGGITAKNGQHFANEDLSRAFNILIGSESGGQQFDAKGNPLTSRKGAIGVAQLMPETAKEAATMAKVEWDPERYKNDLKYNRTLGMAHFKNLVRKLGGVDKAYAAYNAGEGRLKTAMNAAAAAGQPDKWLSRLPRETRNYVSNNMEDYTGRPYTAPQQVAQVGGTVMPGGNHNILSALFGGPS